MRSITSLLKGYFVYDVSPRKKDLLGFLKMAKEEKRIVHLMYGETYDSFGMTIDSLKYYFFVSLFHRLLEEEGITVESTILIADRASVLNPSVREKEELFDKAKNRVKVLEKIIELYDLPIRPVLMSTLFEDPKIQKAIDVVKNFSLTSLPVQQLFAKTVLKNKIAQEKLVGFQYAVEAVATSLQFDIKIGPPREQYYDKAAQIIGSETNLGNVYGIYLRPTYPLGENFSYFILNKEIEEFGITPYKAGSNKLQDNRIILGQTTQGQLESLVNTSYIPTNMYLANPVVDLYTIADLACLMLEKKYIVPTYSLTLQENYHQLREATIKAVKEYVLEPLQKGVHI